MSQASPDLIPGLEDGDSVHPDPSLHHPPPASSASPTASQREPPCSEEPMEQQPSGQASSSGSESLLNDKFEVVPSGSDMPPKKGAGKRKGIAPTKRTPASVKARPKKKTTGKRSKKAVPSKRRTVTKKVQTQLKALSRRLEKLIASSLP